MEQYPLISATKQKQIIDLNITNNVPLHVALCCIGENAFKVIALFCNSFKFVSHEPCIHRIFAFKLYYFGGGYRDIGLQKGSSPLTYCFIISNMETFHAGRRIGVLPTLKYTALKTNPTAVIIFCFLFLLPKLMDIAP